ncbi:MAG: RidA family protein [Alphaproteobacteria bacterium]|nr:RidA family protein [Alphaproteobacteria bacterium]
MKTLLPAGWPRPKGYSNGIAADGTQVHIAGMVGWNPETSEFETDDFAGQFRQTLESIVAVLAEAGGKPEHIVRFTWYITDKAEYLASLSEVGAAYRDVIGRHYPVMAAIEIKGLMEPRAKIEIETYAVIPKD